MRQLEKEDIQVSEDVHSVLSVRGLVAGYVRDAPIVHGVSYDFRPGSVTVVIGPNGAGKSTLLKSIAGLVDVFAGDIVLGQESLVARAATDRVLAGLNFCPQGRANFPNLTVADNLRLAGYSLPRATLEQRLTELRTTNPLIQERWRERIANMSGGEQQRVEIEMSLITRPKVLLLDEPSLGLAPAAWHKIFDQVRLIADGGVTVVIVEQNVRAAVRIADKLIVLEQGQMVLSGKPDEILEDGELRRVYLGTVGR
jgi:branched-chain amino acid transport system ATP-binding protein